MQKDDKSCDIYSVMLLSLADSWKSLGESQ